MKTKKNSNQNVRRTSSKRYAKIESGFNESFEHRQKLLNKKTELEPIISKKLIEIPAEKTGGVVKIIRLNAFQLAGYRTQLAETKSDLKIAEKDMKSKGLVYSSASMRNAASAKNKVKQFNERSRLAKKAVENFDDISQLVNKKVSELSKKRDPRIAELKMNAKQNGRKFYNDFQRLLRTDIKDANVKAMIAASSPVKTELSNMIRRSFGWVGKR